MMFCLYESLKYIIDLYPRNEDRPVAYNITIYLNRWFRQYKNIKEINIEAEYINITESMQVIYDTSYNILTYE